MNQRCPHKIDCEGSDSPIANLTSETPESQYWRAIDYCCNGAIKQYFSHLSFDDAIDGVQRLLVTSCPSCPPDSGDDSYTCDAMCADGSASVTASSTLSQEDACFKAQELANQIPCPPVTPPPPYHCNDTQICESINEDGTYTYIILPCTIYGESPAAANAIALSRACERAKENRIKLGPITRCCCANEVYSSTIKVISEETTLTYAVISGTVPPGITVGTGTTTSKTILVSGTPTTAGTYTFSLRAYDNSGNYATRQYTIAVIEITTTSLPDFTVGVAYSYQLQATGGSGNYAWTIASGTLPEGLSVSETGLISGTPV